MLDRNSVPFFLFYGANRWLAVFLDCMTIIVTGATGFLIVFSLNSENSSQAGLALSFAIQVNSLLVMKILLMLNQYIMEILAVVLIGDVKVNFKGQWEMNTMRDRCL